MLEEKPQNNKHIAVSRKTITQGVIKRKEIKIPKKDNHKITSISESQPNFMKAYASILLACTFIIIT